MWYTQEKPCLKQRSDISTELCKKCEDWFKKKIELMNNYILGKLWKIFEDIGIKVCKTKKKKKPFSV